MLWKWYEKVKGNIDDIKNVSDGRNSSGGESGTFATLMLSELKDIAP